MLKHKLSESVGRNVKYNPPRVLGRNMVHLTSEHDASVQTVLLVPVSASDRLKPVSTG